jgi:16S rRNA processing protein RimM
MSEWLKIGKIVAAQGIKGEVRVYPDSDFPDRFLKPGQRWLLPPGHTEPYAVELLKGYYLTGKGVYVVQFANVSDRNQAEALRGYELLVAARDRPHLEPGEFHVLDLVGLEVFNQLTQTVIGKVISVIPAGNDLLEVELVDKASSKGANKVLIPFVDAIVPIVDLEHSRLEITPPAGLLDLL